MFLYKYMLMESKRMMWTNNQGSTLRDSTVVAEKELPLKRHQLPKLRLDLLQSVYQWLDGIQIHNPKSAPFLCKVIPAQCPFEHDIKHLVDAMKPAKRSFHLRQIPLFYKADPDYGTRVAQGLGIKILSCAQPVKSAS